MGLMCVLVDLTFSLTRALLLPRSDLALCCGQSPQDLSLRRPSAERAVGLMWWAGTRAGKSQVPLNSGQALPFCSKTTKTGK